MKGLPEEGAARLRRDANQTSPAARSPQGQPQEEPAASSPILACLTARPHSSHARKKSNQGGAVTLQSASGAALTEWEYIKALGVKLLLRRTLCMLLGKDRGDRDSSLRHLLPSCVQAATCRGGQLSELALSAVWECCR